MKPVFLIIYFTASALCYSQSPEYSPKVELAIETYAFLKGQKAALQKVAAQYPSFAEEVRSIEEKAEGTYGRAEKNIEEYLKEELKERQYTNLEKNIELMANEQLSKPIEKMEHAAAFLQTVKEKINFNQAENIPAGIISFAYHDTPHQEVVDGHIENYSTKGHPKADESIVTFPIPKSWIAEEGEMPATVQQFTSFEGKGNEKIMMVIHKLAKEDRNLLLNEKSVSEMIPPTVRLIRIEKATIDDMPGIMVEVEETLDTSVNKMKVRMMQFMVTYQEKLYCLQGSIGPVALEENLDHQFRKFEPLFRLVAEGTEIEF